MRILICAHAFAPQIGGVETNVMNLARGLAERDRGKAVSVTVVAQSEKKILTIPDCHSQWCVAPELRNFGN